MYTDPAYRRRGIARRLMEKMVEWLIGQGFCEVSLNASDFGRPLYEQLGFRPTNEMRLALRNASRDAPGMCCATQAASIETGDFSSHSVESLIVRMNVRQASKGRRGKHSQVSGGGIRALPDTIHSRWFLRDSTVGREPGETNR